VVERNFSSSSCGSDELAAVFVATGRSSERRLGVSLALSELLDRDAGLFLELLESRLGAGAGVDRLGRTRDAVVRVEHVDRDADCAPLVGQGTADRVADPPAGVGREAVAALMVETLDRLHEADVALLNEVDQW
jgi:hypothetical protein